jgi:hypothetical protein
MVTKYTSVYFQTLHKVYKLILLGRPHQLNGPTEFQGVLDEKKLSKEHIQQKTSSVDSVLKGDTTKKWVAEIGNQYNLLITDKSSTPRQDWKVRYCQEFARTPPACSHVWTGLTKTHFNWVTGATANDHVAHRGRIVKALASEYWTWMALKQEFVTDRPWLHKLFDLVKKQIVHDNALSHWSFWLPLDDCEWADGVLVDDADANLVDSMFNQEMAANKVKLDRAWKEFSRALNKACGVNNEDNIKKLHPAFKRDFLGIEKVSYNTYHSLFNL